MPKINVEAFFDGYTGAGLFGKLGRPAGDDGRVADNKYTLMLSICATISLLALIGFTILLYTDGHAKMAVAMAGYGVLWVFAGYDRERKARQQFELAAPGDVGGS